MEGVILIFLFVTIFGFVATCLMMFVDVAFRQSLIDSRDRRLDAERDWSARAASLSIASAADRPRIATPRWALGWPQRRSTAGPAGS
jgi:hypothetical protein